MTSFHTTIAAIVMQYDQQGKDTVEVSPLESEMISVSNCAKNSAQNKINFKTQYTVIGFFPLLSIQVFVYVFILSWKSIYIYIHYIYIYTHVCIRHMCFIMKHLELMNES